MKKLLLNLLILLISPLLFLAFHGNAQATVTHTVKCANRNVDFSYHLNQGSQTGEADEIVLSINQQGLATSTKYRINFDCGVNARQSGSYCDSQTISITSSGPTNIIPKNVLSKNYDQSTPTTVELNDPSNTRLCTDSFVVSDVINSDSSGNGSNPGNTNACQVSFKYPVVNGQTADHFTTDETPAYNIDGPLPDPNTTGITIVDANGGQIMNTCVQTSALASTNPAVPINTVYSGTLNTGQYNLRVYGGCVPLFNTANTGSGKPLCSGTFTVCSSGENCTPAGGACTPDDPKTTNVNENTCGKDAPFCIPNTDKSTATAMPNICSKAPTYEQKCDITNKTCETAIGPFGFDPSNFAKSVLQVFLALGGVILLFTLILNGYKFMTSQGDPEKIKESREAIIAAISGLLVIIFAIVILQFVTIDLLHLPGFNPIP